MACYFALLDVESSLIFHLPCVVICVAVCLFALMVHSWFLWFWRIFFLQGGLGGAQRGDASERCD